MEFLSQPQLQLPHLHLNFVVLCVVDRWYFGLWWGLEPILELGFAGEAWLGLRRKVLRSLIFVAAH